MWHTVPRQINRNLDITGNCTGKENMKEFTLGVLPYLVLKREQAALALETIAVDGKNPELRKEQWLK